MCTRTPSARPRHRRRVPAGPTLLLQRAARSAGGRGADRPGAACSPVARGACRVTAATTGCAPRAGARGRGSRTREMEAGGRPYCSTGTCNGGTEGLKGKGARGAGLRGAYGKCSITPDREAERGARRPITAASSDDYPRARGKAPATVASRGRRMANSARVPCFSSGPSSASAGCTDFGLLVTSHVVAEGPSWPPACEYSAHCEGGSRFEGRIMSSASMGIPSPRASRGPERQMPIAWPQAACTPARRRGGPTAQV